MTAARKPGAIKPGDRVLLTAAPDMPGLPAESQALFRWCLGKTFRVEFIDKNGLLCLDVSREADARYGGRFNSILVEPRCVVRL